jgi:hypothetical protein
MTSLLFSQKNMIDSKEKMFRRDIINLRRNNC